jgi:hypothetical protein
MSKVTAPLLSFGASGQIAKSLVFGTWKGVPYSRRYVIPSNPRSADQTLTRNSFKFLSDVYKVSPTNFRATWQRYAVGKAMTDRNAFIKQNNSMLRVAADLDGMWFSPGAFGGLPVVPVVTPGDNLLTVTAAPPDPLPPGWTVLRFVAAAILNQDPQAPTDFDIVEGSDSSDPYSVVLALGSALEYSVAGWFVYQRSALTTDLAYGPAQGVLATTT